VAADLSQTGQAQQVKASPLPAAALSVEVEEGSVPYSLLSKERHLPRCGSSHLDWEGFPAPNKVVELLEPVRAKSVNFLVARRAKQIAEAIAAKEAAKITVQLRAEPQPKAGHSSLPFDDNPLAGSRPAPTQEQPLTAAQELVARPQLIEEIQKDIDSTSKRKAIEAVPSEPRKLSKLERNMFKLQNPELIRLSESLDVDYLDLSNSDQTMVREMLAELTKAARKDTNPRPAGAESLACPKTPVSPESGRLIGKLLLSRPAFRREGSKKNPYRSATPSIASELNSRASNSVAYSLGGGLLRR
jgi:uncharacterized protein YjgD (DUF1641 family)